MGIVYALIAAVIYAVASTAQAWAATRVHGPAVVRHPAYVLGMVGDGVGWLVSVVAMASLPLFAVQSLLASSLALTAVFVSVLLHIRLRVRDMVSIAVLIPALALIAASAPQGSAHPASSFVLVMVIAMVVLVVVSMLVYPSGVSWLSAVLGGLGFSGAALCVRAVESMKLGPFAMDSSGLAVVWSHGHCDCAQLRHLVMTLIGDPLVWVMMMCGLVGVIMYARSMEMGSAVAATAILWAVEVLAPAILGVLLLGDVLTGVHLVVAAGGVVAVLVCSWILATSPAQA